MEKKDVCDSSNGIVVNPFGIEGLTLVPNFLSTDEQRAVLECIDALEWSTAIKRKTMQFGYAYHYRSQNSRPEKAPSIPEALTPICERLKDEAYFDEVPDQLIVNHYNPKEGIGKHIDHVGFWGPSVASISLLSEWNMEFSRTLPVAEATSKCIPTKVGDPAPASARGDDTNQPLDKQSSSNSSDNSLEAKHTLSLPVGSLVVLRGPARYEWKHGIPRNDATKGSRKNANAEATKSRRGPRISVTFRTHIAAKDS